MFLSLSINHWGKCVGMYMCVKKKQLVSHQNLDGKLREELGWEREDSESEDLERKKTTRLTYFALLIGDKNPNILEFITAAGVYCSLHLNAFLFALMDVTGSDFFLSLKITLKHQRVLYNVTGKHFLTFRRAACVYLYSKPF